MRALSGQMRCSHRKTRKGLNALQRAGVLRFAVAVSEVVSVNLVWRKDLMRPWVENGVAAAQNPEVNQ
jgi:hypothetical protein